MKMKVLSLTSSQGSQFPSRDFKSEFISLCSEGLCQRLVQNRANVDCLKMKPWGANMDYVEMKTLGEVLRVISKI